MFGAPFASAPFAMFGQLPLAPKLPSFFPKFILEVDWDNDGDFTDTYDNISPYMTSIETVVGRDYASQLIGQSVAGTLRASLDNSSGIWSPFNSASPLHNKLLPKRKVRLRSTMLLDNIWTGFLSGPPRPNAQKGTYPQAQLDAVGPLALLDSVINPPGMQNVSTGQVINAILDAINWPVGQRQIDDGDVLLGHWFVENITALQAIQDIVDAEGGSLFEGTNWDIVFHSRYHRILADRSINSQFELKDNVAGIRYDQIDEDDPLRQIFNRVEVVVTQYANFLKDRLWEADMPFIIQPGQSYSLTAEISTSYFFFRAGFKEIAFVDPWDTPIVGTDIIQTGVADSDIGVSVVKRAKSMIIKITNNHASLPCTIEAVRAYGVPVMAANPQTLIKEDIDSQGNYDIRNYPFSTSFFPNVAWADAAQSWVLANYKDPHPVISCSFPYQDLDVYPYAVYSKLADRISLLATSKETKFGVDEDFYIESIHHNYNVGGLPRIVLALSSAPAVVPQYWRVGVSHLDVDTKLAY